MIRPENRRRWVVIGLVLLLVIAVAAQPRHPRRICISHVLVAPTAADARAWLISAIAGVPCTATGRSAYELTDNRREAMQALDPVAEPSGGYLGVYRSRGGIAVGDSTDLLHWRFERMLDGSAAGGPALQPIPGAPGFLLAFPRRAATGDLIRIAYYPSRQALLSGHEGAQVDLPPRLGAPGDGAPAFRSITWRGGPGRSAVRIGFTYRGPGGLERQAVGTLAHFHRWTVGADAPADAELSRQGFAGGHDAQRPFSFESGAWSIGAAESHPGTGWQLLLRDARAESFSAVPLLTRSGRFPTSFRDPVVQVLPSPTGQGDVLATAVYVAGGGEAPGPGELLYYQPIR